MNGLLANHGEGAAKCTRARGGFVQELVSELSPEGQEDPIGGTPRSLGTGVGSMGTGLGFRSVAPINVGLLPTSCLKELVRGSEIASIE